MFKNCSRCALEKHSECFRYDESCKDGRRNVCKNCSRNADPIGELPYEDITPCPPPVPVSFRLNDRMVGALPDPADLPAAYLKQCADYWNDLVDDRPNNIRIA
jgi:hypothetical protein